MCPRTSRFKDTSMLVYFVDKKLVFVAALACKMVECNLAHTYALRRNLNKLVALDILQALLKAHNHLRYNACLLV